MNPLLQFEGLPLFDQVTPADVGPAIEALLTEANTALETVTAPAFPAIWVEISRVLDVSTERLGRAWGQGRRTHPDAAHPQCEDQR